MGVRSWFRCDVCGYLEQAEVLRGHFPLCCDGEEMAPLEQPELSVQRVMLALVVMALLAIVFALVPFGWWR